MRSAEEIEADIETTRGIFEAARVRLITLSLEHLSAVAKAAWPDAAELMYEAEYDSSERCHFPAPVAIIMADGELVNIEPTSDVAEWLLYDLEPLCDLDPDTYLHTETIPLN